ncbi:hypothetical protein GCM10027168_17290 [Streptomyces capparidis]
MSEYQYYEFMSVDRPLDSAEQAEVRALSAHAAIDATGCTATYESGDFGGDPDRLVERYYDAHLHVTDWGTRRLVLRLPADRLALPTAEAYCLGDGVSAWTSGPHLILDLRHDDEEADWDETAETTLADLIAVRTELADGDLRPLYLAWLSALGAWELEDDDEDAYQSAPEPPLPPGLDNLTPAQRTLSGFLRVDPDLLAVAARRSRTAATLLDEAAVHRQERGGRSVR